MYVFLVNYMYFGALNSAEACSRDYTRVMSMCVLMIGRLRSCCVFDGLAKLLARKENPPYAVRYAHVVTYLQ